jgi:threonyl-tRNA synthetase
MAILVGTSLALVAAGAIVLRAGQRSGQAASASVATLGGPLMPALASSPDRARRIIVTRGGVRVEVDSSDDRMAKKIVNHTNQKVPFMLLAGDRDVEAGAVSFRFADRSQINGVPREQAIAAIGNWIADRENAVPNADTMKVRGD